MLWHPARAAKRESTIVSLGSLINLTFWSEFLCEQRANLLGTSAKPGILTRKKKRKKNQRQNRRRKRKRHMEVGSGELLAERKTKTRLIKCNRPPLQQQGTILSSKTKKRTMPRISMSLMKKIVLNTPTICHRTLKIQGGKFSSNQLTQIKVGTKLQ
jgi:hypothetical protein